MYLVNIIDMPTNSSSRYFSKIKSLLIAANRSFFLTQKDFNLKIEQINSSCASNDDEFLVIDYHKMIPNYFSDLFCDIEYQITCNNISFKIVLVKILQSKPKHVCQK
jgi:hypothetical protein